MAKTTIGVTLDQDVAANTYDLRKARKLSSIINELLREYTGTNKTDEEKHDDLSDEAIDEKITKLVVHAEKLRQEKTKRQKEQTDKFKDYRFID